MYWFCAKIEKAAHTFNRNNALAFLQLSGMTEEITYVIVSIRILMISRLGVTQVIA
jgi:hypothetical protein